MLQVLLSIIYLTGIVYSHNEQFDLIELIEYGLKNNPQILINEKDLEIENLNILYSKSEKFPSINISSSANRYKYPYPITPFYFSSGKLIIPEFDKSIYNLGYSFLFPLYKGGRIDNSISISEIKKNIKELLYSMNKQELEYAIANLYFKILELEKLKESAEFSVQQMEIHRTQAENFYLAGSAPKIDLLKAEVELSKAKENLLYVKNNLEVSFEILKYFLGMKDLSIKIDIIQKNYFKQEKFSFEEAKKIAFNNRIEIKEIKKRKNLIEKRLSFLKGNKLPEVYLSQDFFLNSGNDFNFKENWGISLRVSYPLFDKGKTKIEIEKERKEMDKIKEEERGLKIKIEKELKEAIINLQNSEEKIDVLKNAIEEAKENFRIEQLRYEAGASTSKDVIDAEIFYLSTETIYNQAIYERDIAKINLYKAMGFDLLDILRKFEEN